MIRFLTKTAVVVFFAPAVFSGEKAKELKQFFCVQSSQREWGMQKYPPLINPRARTIYSELWASGTMIERVRLRRFERNRDLIFEYHFDVAGNLKSIRASLSYWGYWVAESDLVIQDGNILPPSMVRYYKSRVVEGEDRRPTMANPDEKSRYVDELSTAPPWTNAQETPCANKLS